MYVWMENLLHFYSVYVFLYIFIFCLYLRHAGYTTYSCTYVFTLGIRTDEPALFANSWAVDLAHERACPSVDLDFSGPCQSESDMDVRTTEAIFPLNNMCKDKSGPPKCTIIKPFLAVLIFVYFWWYIILHIFIPYFICMQDAIEKCSALLFFPFLSCHENIDPNPFVASCVSDLCV